MNLKNIFWNIAGLGAPAVCAALTIPWLISMIGLERFGILSIAWGLIAQAGLLDLVVGRATTQFVAKLLGREQEQDIPVVISIAVTLTIMSGLAVALIFSVSIFCGLSDFIKATPEVASEIKLAAYLLALTLPVQAMSSTYRGINEAFQDFKGISIVRIFLGVVNFLGPFLVALVTIKLVWLISTLLISRLISVFVYRRLAIAKLQSQANLLVGNTHLDKRKIARELIGFGGWFTFGSGVSFFLNQSEKIAIAVIISATAVSAFAIPFEVVLQSLAVTTAISTIAFPQLSTMVQSDPAQALKTFHVWLIRILAMMFGICLTMAIALPSVLQIWVGAKLPVEALWISQVLCIGVFARTINVLCTSMIHAYGRADLITLARLAELPVFLGLLVVWVNYYGVYGAAYTWCTRQIVDSAILYYLMRKQSLQSTSNSVANRQQEQSSPVSLESSSNLECGDLS